MMNLTTLPKSFWGYALETAARILNMVSTKKVDRTPYEIWHGKALKLSCLRDWGFRMKNSKKGYTLMMEKPDYIKSQGAKTPTEKSAKQSTTVMSSTEAEYIVVAEASMEAVWMRKIIDELDVMPSNKRPMEMLCISGSIDDIARLFVNPMYAPPNMLMYPNPTGSFTDSTGSVTPFVRWIEDYPLPNGLKIPSRIGSYDGKRDPDNFLHLFEGAIRMQKWLMPIACHMFTYTHKDFARIWWNGQKIELRISGFVHGLRTRILVEHLFTNLLTTYKGLMEKTYTWMEGREVATNGTPNDRRENTKRSRKSSWDNNRGQKGKDRRKVMVYWENSSRTLDRRPPSHKKETLNFMIVKSTSPYIMLLGRTTMQKMEIMVSTIHGAIKFHTTRGIGTVFLTHKSDKVRE
nr:retrovirus-related Pol polyprotein from transposon TNT 1-94 [Tanacetum cinerariifolium]